ncbi:beta-class carbonic anhydrase [Priestia taiwanensis]|uniref:carbonic anhydrase n=1 Tax=Priestia taiwanensis TaxID=1347902 RepID=A0A917AXG6_9BACI|nr:carbonic anhydrase [Priestia taiwanensis]MBM7363334.1 carbonic anhydrase [Priestia taiwanensis]GGE78007.1 carbonic anhydrase [Priestia taiwanensis]
MTLLHEILEHNEKFVTDKEYEKFETSKYPEKRLVIVSCMDTRLVELLPRAMNIGNGDVKVVKVAGAVISHPFGSIMRSILVAIYALNADEVCVVGHHDCGMATLKADDILDTMRDRGISDLAIEAVEYFGVDLEKWLHGFDCVEESVSESVKMIRNHPLLPSKLPVHGLVIDPKTGKLDVVVDGYNK